MKKIVIILTLLPTIIFAQKVDYNDIILPQSAVDVGFPEKLIQLAWQNNPANEILNREREIAEHDVKLSKFSWLENMRIQGNVNEFIINPSSDVGNRAQFFPKYNVSGFVNLGTFFLIPTETKKRKENVLIANARINSQKLLIRAQVLRNYQDYVMNRELLRIQTEASEDALNAFSIAEQNFKNGTLGLEEYNASLKAYNHQQVLKITAENKFNISKINLEELIGIKLEDVK